MDYVVYDMDTLTEKMRIEYPDEITPQTDEKRNYNRERLIEFIDDDIARNALVCGVKERRVELYTTSLGEKIYIQYPGIFSKPNRNGEVRFSYDFRPICINDSLQSIDLKFADIWEIIDGYITDHKDFVPILNNLLFRIGRMTDHQLVEKDYDSELIDQNGRGVLSDTVRIKMYCLKYIDEKVRASLNLHARKINMGNGVFISLEAFLYYLDCLIQIEDCKYKEKAIDDTHGRIATSDTLMVIYAYRIGKIRLSELLQRFVQRRGIATCTYDEYKAVTHNTVNILEIKNRIENLCQEYDIEINKTKKIENGIESIKNDCIRIQIPQKHILILNGDKLDVNEKTYLDRNGWRWFDIFSFDTESIGELERIIIDAPDYFDFHIAFEKIKTDYPDVITRKQTIVKGNTKIKPYTTIKGLEKIAILQERPTKGAKKILDEKGFKYRLISSFKKEEDIIELFENQIK